ncbi:MAG: glycosyltransferase family A protein [Candidatus Melainabacteria bacterium]|nr:glycosyltransferase family A protein [Candidatus Melainabacteria bacterium]
MVSLDEKMPNSSGAQVSVIVPVRNGARYVGETIASILAQTVPPLEVLIMDDASDDETATIAKSFGSPVRHFLLKQRGAAAARNSGVDAAKGNYLSFLDADDLWLPEKTERQLDCLIGHAASRVAFCHMEQFISPEIKELSIADKDKVLPGFSSCTMLIHADVFRSIGSFCENLRAGEFIEWFSRARDARIEPVMLSDILARRRIHKSNQGLTNDGRQDYLRIAKMLIDKKRTAEGKPSA